MTDTQYKALSIKEFSKAARVYETDEAGVYRMCRKDYPDVLSELEKEDFTDLLDCGCGTAPMLSLLKKKYPEKHYTGIDLTPEMIEVARAKNMRVWSSSSATVRSCPFRTIPSTSSSAARAFTTIRMYRISSTACTGYCGRAAG